MSDDWLRDDPFVDPNDPAAQERERRRLEREEKRRQRAAKQEAAEEKARKAATEREAKRAAAEAKAKQAADEAKARQVAAEEKARQAAAEEEAKQAALREEAPQPPPAPDRKTPLPPPPSSEEPPLPLRSPRTPEQEFWDEEPDAEPATAAAPIATEPVYHDDGDPEMAAAARNGRRAGEGGGPRDRSGVLGAIARHPFRLFAAIALLFLLWSLGQLFQPFHGDGSGTVPVTVPKGSSVSEVGDLLS